MVSECLQKTNTTVTSVHSQKSKFNK